MARGSTGGKPSHSSDKKKKKPTTTTTTTTTAAPRTSTSSNVSGRTSASSSTPSQVRTKKKQKISATTKEKEEEEHDENGTATSSKKSKKAKMTNSSSEAAHSSPLPTATAKPRSSLGGDNIQVLKERFNALHQVRYTEPEKQNVELLKLVDEQRIASDILVKKLESRISHLEKDTKEVTEFRKREQKLLDECAQAKGEVEKLKRSLEYADQERISLVKALETVNSGGGGNPSSSPTGPDSATMNQIVQLLDLFKTVTGVTLKLNEDDLSQGTCIVYNSQTKRGVRFAIAISDSDQTLSFTPAANKSFLPPDMRNGTTKLKRDECPQFLAKVMNVLF